MTCNYKACYHHRFLTVTHPNACMSPPPPPFTFVPDPSVTLTGPIVMNTQEQVRFLSPLTSITLSLPSTSLTLSLPSRPSPRLVGRLASVSVAVFDARLGHVPDPKLTCVMLLQIMETFQELRSGRFPPERCLHITIVTHPQHTP